MPYGGATAVEANAFVGGDMRAGRLLSLFLHTWKLEVQHHSTK